MRQGYFHADDIQARLLVCLHELPMNICFFTWPGLSSLASSCSTMYILAHISFPRPGRFPQHPRYPPWYIELILFASSLFHCDVPSTCPPTVPSSDGAAVSFSFSHSCGVWHFAVQAWMAAISSLSAVLTRRCRLSDLRSWNWGDTIRDVNAWPQPPVCVYNIYC